jgi:hypothetical protein
MNKESIKFQFELIAEFWDKPPHVKIYIDDFIKFDDYLNAGMNVVKFTHDLAFEKHTIKLIRSGKTNDQNQDGKDQLVHINKLFIDGINIRDIVWVKSYSEPKYPEPWATKQRYQGIELEKQVIGETTFGHNSTWYLHFTSPFYKFIMNWMNNGN